jgi:hypothetical protein
MSFILDALKKSENDRQRQSGPALFEVRVAPPRAGFPTWAYALLALLAVNLAVVGWLMLRRPAAAATPPMQAAAAPAPAAATPAPAQTAPGAQPPVAQMGSPPGYGAPPNGQPYPQQFPPNQQQYPQQGGQPQYSQQGGQPQYPQQGYQPNYPQQNYPQQQGYPPPAQQPALAQNYGAPPQQQQAPPQEGNPDDYAPAAESSGGAPLGHVRRGLESGLMTYEEAASKNSIPALHMDLHVYAPDPSKRFVLVNSKKLGEGQSLPEGVKVDSITTDGAILSYRGVQFMMERD